MLESALLMRDLTNDERLMFQSEFTSRRKEKTTGVLLALFLGGFGAHWFYMGRPGIGAIYALFFWTLIPGIIGVVECFLMGGRIRTYNTELANEIIVSIKALRESP